MHGAGRLAAVAGAGSRRGCRTRTGLLTSWPANGPAVVWTAGGLGDGYGSSPWRATASSCRACANARSVVSALNRADGKECGRRRSARRGDNDRGPGPRGTPTVDGDRLYVLTENGDLACLQTDGTEVWQRNILQDFGGRNIPLADQRVAARRRRARDRHARRARAPGW